MTVNQVVPRTHVLFVLKKISGWAAFFIRKKLTGEKISHPERNSKQCRKHEEKKMSTIAATRSKTYDIVYIAVFAVIMAICSWISIPTAVPFTLQTFGVFVAVGVLGGKRGTLSILVFILLGAIGVPVFAGFSGGIGVLAGTTGGYIIGFLFSALVMWAMEKLPGKKSVMQIVSMIVGLIVCYAFGTAWFMIVYSRANGAVGLATVLGWCVIPFIIPDIIKIVLAYGLSRKLRKFVA